jgi:hypothetical protein
MITSIVDIPSVPGVFTISGIPAICCVPAVVSGPPVKGSLTRDFRVQVFSLISFPRAPEYPIGAIANFYTNLRRYLCVLSVLLLPEIN